MNILFVCTGNTCRSPMAAALFNKISTEKDLDVRIESAGIFANAGDSASQDAVEAMKKYGIDLSGHKSQTVSRELLDKCDLVLTMTKTHKNALEQAVPGKVYTVCEFAGQDGEIPDPYGMGTKEYEKCADMLVGVLERVAKRLENN